MFLDCSLTPFGFMKPVLGCFVWLAVLVLTVLISSSPSLPAETKIYLGCQIKNSHHASLS